MKTWRAGGWVQREGPGKRPEKGGWGPRDCGFHSGGKYPQVHVHRELGMHLVWKWGLCMCLVRVRCHGVEWALNPMMGSY